MNQKPLLLAITLIALLVIAGAFWYLQNRPPMAVNQPIGITEPVVETPVLAEPEEYPQHIENIPGNTDQVWYAIPELGVKLLLYRDGAEDTVYKYNLVKNTVVTVDPRTGEEEYGDVSGVVLYSKLVLKYNQTCGTPACRADGFQFGIGKVSGIYNNHPLAFGSKLIKQFKDFYLITGGSPQVVPFANEEEERKFNEAVHLPKVPPLTKMRIEVLE
ncbi:MAG: hypothetical protein WBP40_01195 [Candidatus Moraniibacteriota bacterium]